MVGRRVGWSMVYGVALLAVVACSGAGAGPVSDTAASDASRVTSSGASATGSTGGVTAPSLLSSSSPTTEPVSTEPISAEPISAESAVPSTSVPVPASSEPPATTTKVTKTSTATPPATPPPPAPPATSTANAPGGRKVVVLDPGHNGANGAHPSIINAPVDAGFGRTKACNTTGTETNAGYPEHAFTWAVANDVRTLLEARGVTVIMTRDSDDGVGPCVNVRASIGNDSHADAVVSIHGDGSGAGDRGFYAMTSERDPNGAEMAGRSRSLAAAVRDALVDGGISASNYVGTDGLWKRDDLAGLNLSIVPTTMIEMGNMRDADDATLMKSDAGQLQMARGIANGILDFLGR